MNKKQFTDAEKKFFLIFIEKHGTDETYTEPIKSKADLLKYIKDCADKKEIPAILDGCYPKSIVSNQFNSLHRKTDEMQQVSYTETEGIFVPINRVYKTSVKKNSREYPLFDDRPEYVPLNRKELKKIGFSSFQLQLLDLSIYFAYLQDRCGVFYADTTKIGKHIYPNKRLGTDERQRIEKAFTRLVNAKITTSIDIWKGEYTAQIEGLSLIYPAGKLSIDKKREIPINRKNKKRGNVEVYQSGRYQIDGELFANLLQNFVPVPLIAFQLDPDDYAIYQTIMVRFRMGWNTHLYRETNLLPLNLQSLFELSGIPLTGKTTIRKQIENLHVELDHWVKLGIIKNWFIRYKGAGECNKNWFINEPIIKKVIRDGNQTHKIREDILTERLYCFELTSDLCEKLNRIPTTKRRQISENSTHKPRGNK